METTAVAYRATHEAMPIFGLYALFFADRGLSTTQITVLLAVWSVSAFVLEIPSGAWADLVDRRRLLVWAGVVYTGAFTTWLLWPTFWGFLAGFVLWSLSDAMTSGTFEAYLFDELSAAGRPARYGVVKARAESVALVMMALAIAAAAPLHRLGGYELVGWVSVAATLVHLLIALLLPKPAAPPDPASAPPAHPVPGRAWLRTLRSGLAEARHSLAVRRVLMAYATVVALVGFDEYFPLLLAAGGIAVERVALVLAAIVLLQAAGTWLAGRLATVVGWRHAAVVGSAGVLLSLAAWWGGWPGAAALGLGYVLANTAYVATGIRLQYAMTGGARATVTSVAGVVSELGFLTTLGAIGVTTVRWDLAPVIGVLALLLALPAALAAVRAPAGAPS